MPTYTIKLWNTAAVHGTRRRGTETEQIKKTYVQRVTRSFLYYSVAVDRKRLVSLSAIALKQANTTNKTMKKVKEFLNYVALHQDVIVKYHASYMILTCHSHKLYLSKPKARSQAGGIVFIPQNEKTPSKNVSVLNIAHLYYSVAVE